MAIPEDAFEKANTLRRPSLVMNGGDPEVWGENEHGYFSYQSGKFVSKEDANDDVFLRPMTVDISWPGRRVSTDELPDDY